MRSKLMASIARCDELNSVTSSWQCASPQIAVTTTTGGRVSGGNTSNPIPCLRIQDPKLLFSFSDTLSFV
jgi:hypothetical protein